MQGFGKAVAFAGVDLAARGHALAAREVVGDDVSWCGHRERYRPCVAVVELLVHSVSYPGADRQVARRGSVEDGVLERAGDSYADVDRGTVSGPCGLDRH